MVAKLHNIKSRPGTREGKRGPGQGKLSQLHDKQLDGSKPKLPQEVFREAVTLGPWDGTFKSADDLQQLYGGKGINGKKETIAYFH